MYKHAPRHSTTLVQMRRQGLLQMYNPGGTNYAMCAAPPQTTRAQPRKLASHEHRLLHTTALKECIRRRANHERAKQINVPNHEANEFLNAYFSRFPEIKTYMDDTIKFCRKSGYVNNIFGRRSHFNGINDKNFNVRNFQERASINAPIQGSASEIMRLAMIRLDQKFENLKNNKSKILLQIHDELIFEVPEKEVETITKIIQEEMTSVTESDLHSFSTPLTVDVNIGSNWGILH